MLELRVLRSLAATAAVAIAAAACADGNGATPTESVAGPEARPTFSATNVAPPAPAATRALLRGYRAIVDMTQTLDENTPIIQLPDPFSNSPGYTREEISFFDFPRGPAWAWYSFNVGEHTGTHFDAPCHWISGRDKACLDDVPVEDLVGAAVVIDVRDKVADNADYLVTVDDLLAWEAQYGRIPARAWVILQTGWASRYSNAAEYLNGGHWPGPSAELSEYLVTRRDILGLGVETVGTDSGIAGGLDPVFPNHYFVLGAGRYGLTSLANVDQLPPRGALLIAAPMKLRDGTGAPVRVLAFVP